MLKAKDIMTPAPVTLSPDMDIPTAARLLLEKKINGAPVLDAEGRLAGILCQSDLIAKRKNPALPSYIAFLDAFIQLPPTKALETEWKKVAAATVAQAMTPSPRTVTPETPLEEIATLMVEKKLYTLPVVADGKLVGVVGKEDVLRTLIMKDTNRA
ncbi:CBS domain-containing protein [Desulfovibrio aminophilus]|nr:CBS domain-containing protein [Desulfovibrio aminophilus]MCM0754480.1 CBS domain-containing protein [Desulfovibrio aminophilus]